MNLAEHIAEHFIAARSTASSLILCRCGHESRGEAAHAEHVAATWKEHRTITTLPEWGRLPAGTVIRDRRGKVRTIPTRAQVGLPARIIFHPEEDQ